MCLCEFDCYSENFHDVPSTDWTPYIIVFLTILSAIIFKKYFTWLELNRLEKLFFLWIENLILSLKSQSKAYKKQSERYKDIDGDPIKLLMFGVSTSAQNILEVKSDKYFHLFISNRYKGEKLLNLFYRTFRWFNVLIDGENLFMSTRTELNGIFMKTHDDWSNSYKNFTIVFNGVLSDIEGQKSEIELREKLKPIILKYHKLQDAALLEQKSIPKKILINHIKEIDSALDRMGRNEYAAKILNVCDDMMVAEKKIIAIYVALEKLYTGISEQNAEAHKYLTLYLKLWKKTKKRHIPLISLYKPSDF